MFTKGYVYILRSLRDGRQYIGSTTNVVRRLNQHKQGKVNSTRHRRPFYLKYIIEYESIKVAFQMEKKFKRSHNALRRELKRNNLL